MITESQLALIAGASGSTPNIHSVVVALASHGVSAGLDKRWRLAHYLAQLAHESGRFRYDREVWGPTAAQARYDTRTDLGNTPAKDGDGYDFRGRTGIEVTGRANYIAFRDWCRGERYDPPDFETSPDAIDTDPWEGLAPVWFWTIHGLNALADDNNIEMITRRINGGLNGYADRLALYTRAGLVLAGYKPTSIEDFQRAAARAGRYPGGRAIDGIDGPKTRAAIHATLQTLPAA